LVVEYERRFSDKGIVKNDAIHDVGLSFGERDDQIPSIVAVRETVVSGRRARNANTIVTREVCDENIGLSGRVVSEVY
jgi:hypothetical protein